MPGRVFHLQLNLSVCSWVTGVPVHTRRILLLARPYKRSIWSKALWQVLFVRSIELRPSERSGGYWGAITASADPAAGTGDSEATTAEWAAAEAGAARAGAAADDDKAAPPLGMTELPSCPVCLDRLDQDVSGVVTTICSHSFHASCLSKWGRTSGILLAPS